MTATPAKLDRTTLRTSRLLDFCNRKELIAQTGHQPDTWPLVVLKELVDNALDTCEEAGVAPEINVEVGDGGITVTDNGPGIPAETITDVLDFSVRVSSREAYVAPDRGAQGNALKTIVAMPFVLDGYPCGSGLSVDPRTVAALVRAGWIDRDGRPIRADVGVPTDA